MNGLRIALLANLKVNAPHGNGEPRDKWSELDSERTVEAIAAALRQAGHKVTFLEGDESLCGKLQRGHFDIAFNICEGHRGDSRESHVPAVLEMLGIPYTGSKILSLALTLDKPMAKRILAFHGLPTPLFQVFNDPRETLDRGLGYPLFVKPTGEGTGMGINGNSVVRDEGELRSQLRWLIDTYDQPALVEEFIEGREITVGVLGNKQLHVLPPLEVDLSRCPPEERGIYTGRIKSELPDSPLYVCPAALTEAQEEELEGLAVAAFRTLDCLDVARVDFKLDANHAEKPYILEVNPLPGLSPGVSDLVFEAEAEGMSHAQLINAILDAALERYPQLVTRVLPEPAMALA
ncbi:MAG: ATP-grasp domain-containing protein [Anaerolineae bacterium]